MTTTATNVADNMLPYRSRTTTTTTYEYKSLPQLHLIETPLSNLPAQPAASVFCTQWQCRNCERELEPVMLTRTGQWTCKDTDKDLTHKDQDKDKDKDFTYSYLLQVAAKPSIAIKQQQ